MEVTNSLLVVMMFIVLLGLGIGNVLMTLASIVNRRVEVKVSRLHVSWLVLLLLTYFNFFWESLVILDVNDWVFESFIYVMAGPIALLFATSVLTTYGDDMTDLDANYTGVAPQFFLLMALVQAWSVGVDPVLGVGLSSATVVNIMFGAVCLLLMMSKSLQVHRIGTIVAWIVFLGAALARGTGKIQ